MPRIRGWGEWRGRVGELMMFSDAGDQVVCTVGHSSPYHTMSHADIQWDRTGLQATPLMFLKGLTGSIMVLRDFTGSKTGRL